jgi:hypothetical protein
MWQKLVLNFIYLQNRNREKSVSEEQSEIYLTSVVFGDVEYGVIVVKLAEEADKR